MNPQPTDATLEGRWVMGVFGCDLAADAIARQSCIGDLRSNAKVALKCERPALLVVAVEPGLEDEAARRIRAALNPKDNPEGGWNHTRHV